MMTTVFKFLIVFKEEVHSYTKHAEKFKKATQRKEKKKEIIYYQDETSVVLSLLN